MTDTATATPITLPAESVAEARRRVNEAFAGFVGNVDAIYAVKRSLIVALSSVPTSTTGTDATKAAPVAAPVMARTFLLSGPPSTGKSEMARRITNALGLPFVRIDGRAVRSREKLIEMIDDALRARDQRAQRSGERSGMPVIVYPAFSVFIDEIHLVSERMQESFLTMLEQDDRTITLDGEAGRRVADVSKAAFLFATTKPADLDRAFRSRCIEVQLARYTAPEVAQMTRQRYPQLPTQIVDAIATCSRMVPRQAFALAQDVFEEVLTSGDDTATCLRRVMAGRGILWMNGATRDDLRYLEILRRERRPMGETAVLSSLYDVDKARVSEDIEPFLLLMGYIAITPKGRVITLLGDTFVQQAREQVPEAAPVRKGVA